MTDRMLDAALAWAAQGYRVFPLCPNTKIPLPGSNGFKDASSDSAVVEAMRWEIEGQPCNLGVATGAPLSVLDVDVKGGKDGFASLAKVGLTRDFLEGHTYSVATPNGGCHFYFRAKTPVRSRVDVLGRGSGVDIRGAAAFIVAPPSQIDGRLYRSHMPSAQDESEIVVPPLADLADWSLVAPFLPDNPEPAKQQFAGGTFGQAAPPDVIERARRYLAACPPAISGQGGHNATFKIASALANGFRLDLPTALILLGEWNRRCQPPWTEQELRHKLWDAALRGPPFGKPLGWLRDANQERNWLVGPIDGEESDGEGSETDEAEMLDGDADAFPYPPGFVGATAYWLELRSEKPFRAFAIVSALAIWSALVGRKVKFENQSPVLYGVLVAATSNGKDAPLALAREVLQEIGVSSTHLAGRLSSWNAGIEKLQQVWPHPVVLSLVDEAAGYFGGVAGKSDYGLPDFIKAAWSRGLGTLEPQGRTRKSGSTRLRPIHRPSFSMLLAAQPSSLGNAVRTEQLEDGLLARALWVVRNTFTPMISEENLWHTRKLADSIGGEGILTQGRKLWNWLGGADSGFRDIADLESRPDQSDEDEELSPRREVWETPVEFTAEPAARAVFSEFSQATQARIQPAAEGKEGPCGFLWGKAAENAKRIALILAAARCGATDGPFTINETEARWSVSFVESTVKAGIEWAKTHMADTPFQRMVNRVLGIIRPTGAGGISRRDLNRRLRHSYPTTKVEEALQSLRESGTITEELVPTRGASKMVYRIASRRRHQPT